jgi:cytidylate kinase
VFAFIARDRNIPWKGDDCAGLVTYLRNLQIYITPDAEVIVDGVELLVEHLKTQEISELTSQIAQFPMVRELSQTVLNQTLGTLNVAYILIDGRDSDRSIYSLPVLCQIYMDVSFAEAAKRSGESLAEVMERDARDAKRLIEALQSSDIKFPTDSMTLEESAQTLVDHILSTPLP